MNITNDAFDIFPIIPLGHADTRYFYYFVTATRQVVRLTPNQHVEKSFLGMASEQEWLCCPALPMKLRNEVEVIDWSGLSGILMEMCRDVGMYDSTKARGRGAWRDEKDIVYHAGGQLFVNGAPTPFEEYADTRYRYLACPPITVPAPEAATAKECQELMTVLNTWAWQQPEIAPKLVMGWLACAFICGALRWRPHLWITGPKGSGKSTLDTFVVGLLGELVVHVQGGTTEPGLRQSLNGDARPVAFDEFESDGPNAKRIIEAARSAASDNAAPIIKGTPEGKPLTYRLRFAAMLSSVIANVERDTDQSRIVFLELRCRERDEDQRRWLLEALDRYDQEFGGKVLRRMLDALGNGLFDASLSTFRTAVRMAGGDERKADVYAHLLAAYHALVSDAPITVEDAESLVVLLADLDQTEQTDEEACVEQLLGYTVSIDYDRRTIGEWLIYLIVGPQSSPLPEHVHAALERHGIKIIEGELVVANSTSGIKKVFHGTRWSGGAHRRTLRRVPGARTAGNHRFAGISTSAGPRPPADAGR